MDWLNYHHLLYFWTVAREGTIARAGVKLHLGQPAISTQLRHLEKSLGEKLFRKAGRKLELTEAGQMIYRYADDFFRSAARCSTPSRDDRPASRFASWSESSMYCRS